MLAEYPTLTVEGLRAAVSAVSSPLIFLGVPP
jgi:hypothetical protein